MRRAKSESESPVETLPAPHPQAAARDICPRSFAFATRIVKLVRALPKDVAGQTLGRQLVRAGTFVGANVEEAQGSHSRAEYVRRMGIARSEARETLCWLRLVTETGLLERSRLNLITTEANELVSILTAIVKKLRA